ncbi:hypothetical protein SAMN05192559_11453 [Halobacillus karajensis]|uniref:hypothetical protein n=1 Tax=Halobacillus karajensis TaxID=195088 RepID=UPI0008A796D6|nr:hypothetical protein [Halobacillus karajensis]SEI12121.1 hypothetical protein SAMN05192559_11453 [Halobacillus karajensis]
MKVIDNVRLYKPFNSEHENGLYHAVLDNGKFREIKEGPYDKDDNTEIIKGVERHWLPHLMIHIFIYLGLD